MVLNVLLSGAAFVYCLKMENRLATLEANQIITMKAFNIVPALPEQKAR